MFFPSSSGSTFTQRHCSQICPPCCMHQSVQSIQSLSRVQLFVIPWTAGTPGFTLHHQLLDLVKLMSIESVMPSSHLILCCPLLLLPSIFPASVSFPVNRLFTSGGQGVGVSSSASILPMNTQDWSPLGWTGWILLHSKGLSRVFSSTTVQKCQVFGTLLFFYSPASHPYMTTGKTIALTRQTFVGKEMSILFNMPTRLVITFLPRSNVF